jgi:hypothetical protein
MGVMPWNNVMTKHYVAVENTTKERIPEAVSPHYGTLHFMISLFTAFVEAKELNNRAGNKQI